MTACARSSTHPPGAWNGGFALVTVLWLAMIGFLGTGFLLGMMGSRRQAIQKVRESLEDRLALEEAVGRVAADPGFVPLSCENIRDTLLTVGDPPRPIRIEIRRWGLWAVAEFFRPTDKDYPASSSLLARRILFGARTAPPGVVAYLRTNPYPLVLANEVRVEGIVALQDSIQTASWRGFRYRYPRPVFRRAVAPFEPVDFWQDLPDRVHGWISDPATAPDGVRIHRDGFGLLPPLDPGVHLIVVDGDARLRGLWNNRLHALYITGDLELMPGTVFRGQLLVEGRVRTRQARLEWPTLLAVRGRDDPSATEVELLEGTSLSGCLAVVPGNRVATRLLGRHTPTFYLNETSELHGTAYVRGSVQMNGLLQGWIETDETMARVENGTYHNWLLQGIWQPADRSMAQIPFPLTLQIGGMQTVVIEGLR